MSQLKIWGRMSSINVKKAVWTAQELGLDFERHEAGGVHGVVKTPEYVALNPNSQIPVLQDGDYVLWESNVITRYLCAKHSPGSVYPTDLQERFDAERWMEWQQTTVNPASRNGFWHLIRLPADQRDPALIAQSNAAVELLMAMLDAHLSSRSFMVGERFTMADIPLGCEVHRWFGLPQPREKRPHIEHWFAALAARPAAKGVLDMALTKKIPMQQRPFKQIDVFTATPYFGNPLAVVLDGSGLDDAAMQRFAQWTNLSETTFVLPPTQSAADYRLRIFTPGGELPFAGHPTLGSCHAWLEAGGQPKSKEFIVQECAKGLIPIRRDATGASLAFAAPSLARSAPSPVVLAQVASALGLKATQIIAAQLLDNGPVWLGVLLDSPDTVLQLMPNHQELAKLGFKVGVAGIYESPSATLIAKANREAQAFAQSESAAAPDLEVRAFAACNGINEDPVTGSLNASLAQWLMADELMPAHYTASQGVCMGRAGQVDLRRDSVGQVWVGGQSVTCIDGTVTL